jgi:hypothetical protein
MANYVPEGQDNSASKQTFGRRRPNYVPAPGEAPAARGAGREQQAQEAKAELAKRHARSKQTQWENACILMRRYSNPGSAIGFLQDLPPAVREMHLLAEEQGLNRGDVLGYFPPAGPTARETWSGFAGPVEQPTLSKTPSSTSGKRNK